MNVVKTASKYLGVSEAALSTVLVTRSIEVRGEKSIIALPPKDARDGTDALAKAIYGRLFDWKNKKKSKFLLFILSTCLLRFLLFLKIISFVVYLLEYDCTRCKFQRL